MNPLARTTDANAKQSNLSEMWWERHFRGFEAHLPPELMCNLAKKFMIDEDDYTYVHPSDEEMSDQLTANRLTSLPVENFDGASSNDKSIKEEIEKFSSLASRMAMFKQDLDED